MGRIEERKNKEKLQFNEPRLNSTRSSSFDLVYDELQVYFAQFLIPAQKSQQREIMPSGIATWQVINQM